MYTMVIKAIITVFIVLVFATFINFKIKKIIFNFTIYNQEYSNIFLIHENKYNYRHYYSQLRY